MNSYKLSKEAKLIRYCKKCDFVGVQELINPKNRLLTNSSNGFNHLNKTLQQNTINVVSHIDVNYREPKFQMTPLMVASLRGSRDIVLYLIRHGANVSMRDIKGNTALHLACMKQRFHVIDALLQNKANPNDINMSGWNCLISAVNYFHEDSAIMLLLLLQTGSKCDHKDNSGLTCIDYAVRKNKINAIRVILNFNIKLATSCTRALINASIKGYFDIVLMLLNFGVNPNKIDIITGTGPLHEAVRYNDMKDENSRLERLKIVYYLTLFGADPETPNLKRETPLKLALIKHQKIAEQYVEAMKGFYTSEPKLPKFININATSLKDLFHVPNYPLLRPQSNWTRNDFRFCSSYDSNSKTDLVTNLIDGDPNSMWIAPGQNLNWVIFDLKADHCISMIRIYAWKSKEMPSECFLQVSNSLEGPWSNVQTFKCEMIGSSLRNSPGMPIDFNGFHAVARFWRLVIVKNHGASQTSFHGVEFFGYDYRISKLIDQLKLTEYEDVLIQNDLNQIEALVGCTYQNFEKIPIERKSDKDKLWNFILEFQKKVRPLKKLEWFNEPLPYGLVGQNLSAFSVTSTAFLTDALQLISHGGGLIKGETCIDMEPGGMNDPSMAIFRNISFSNAGKFILEIKSLNDPEVAILSQPIQIFEYGDPQYDKLVKLHTQNLIKNNSIKSKNKHHNVNKNDDNEAYSKVNRKKHNLNQSFGELNDSDDDTLDQIYSFADFSHHTNKMPMKKWGQNGNSQDQDLSGNENDIYSCNDNFDPDFYKNNNFYMVDRQSNNNNLNNSSSNTQKITYENHKNKEKNLKSPKPTHHNSNNDFKVQNNEANTTKFPQNRNNKDDISPSRRKTYTQGEPYINKIEQSPIKHDKSNQYILPEYEIQTFTVDLLDDNISNYSDYFILNQSFKRNNDKLEPKNEARVYVNNPDLLVETYNPSKFASPPRSPVSSEISAKSKIRVDSNDFKYHAPFGSNHNLNNISIKNSGNFNSKSQHFYETERSSSIVRKKNNENSPQKVNPSDNQKVFYSSSESHFINNSNQYKPPPPPPPLPSFLANQTSSETQTQLLPAPLPPSPSQAPSEQLAFNPPTLNITNGNSSVSSGMLKFQKTKSTKNQVTSPTTPPPPPPLPPQTFFSAKTSNLTETTIQDELKSKLSTIRKQVEKNSNNLINMNGKSVANKEEYHSLKANDGNGIYKFDPNKISNNDNNNHRKNEKENKNKSNNDFNMNPNETFTQKAKKALENYKNTRSSNSSNSDILPNHENNLVKAKKSKHAPLPFKNGTNDGTK